MHPQDRSHQLDIDSPQYVEALRQFWKQQLQWDGHDITTEVLEIGDQQVTAEIIAKSDGIISGQEEAEFFMAEEGIEIKSHKTDGERVVKNDVCCTLTGPAGKILKAERTLLNFLSRLSGIATTTTRIVAKLPENILLLPTRKTLWGPIDKKGVVVGGGGTHRLSLADAVLVKENHLALSGIADATEKIDRAKDIGAFWEIEIETSEEFDELMRHLPKKRPGVIMFDNFLPEKISELVEKYEKPEGIYYEASGGITEENILGYSKTGIDSISMGMLTNTVVPLDLSLRLLPN